MKRLADYRKDAREALMYALGGRGCFVRVTREGPIFLTDAARRTQAPDALVRALEAAGFRPAGRRGGMLLFGLPDAAYAIPEGAEANTGPWNQTAWRRQSLCRQLLLFRQPGGPVEAQGRPLVDAMLRFLTGAGTLEFFLQQAAAAQRQGLRGALYLCGLYLSNDLAGDGIGAPEGANATGRFWIDGSGEIKPPTDSQGG